MRAAIMCNQELRVDNFDLPDPGDGQVLVKTLACGICGSDLHTLTHAHRMVDMSERMGNSANRFAVDQDMVMGHEFCAEILDHGPNTQKILKPGTRVVTMPITFTMAGGIQGIGYSNTFPGGYGEQMILSEMLLNEVPNGLSAEHAAMTEPMAVGEHAVVKAQLQGDEVPIVIGCGPVGLAVIAGLKKRGIGPVIAADFSPTRRRIAEATGADIIVDPAAQSPYDSWNEVALPDGYDPTSMFAMMGMGRQPKPCVIFECVGVPGIIQQIFEGAPRGSRAVVVGVCMEKDFTEPLFAIGKELNIQYVLGYSPDEFASTLRAIAEGEILVEPMITGQVGLDAVPQAFKDLGDPEAHAKIIVNPDL